MRGYRIPYCLPTRVGGELEAVARAVENAHLSGDGEYTRRCSELLEELTGSRRVLLTTSCTHALEMCGLLLELGPGDEVIVPSFAFVTTANAFALRGAKPVFVDVRPDTLNLDERLLADRIGPRTRAIVLVHYAGVGCEMDEITKLSRESGVPVIEDNAHGLLGSYRERPLGSFGCLATQSFHETKNFTCGEGGALAINREEWIERAEILREKGTNRSRFFRGQVDKYTWVDLGSSYLPAELNAAYLWAQLEAREQVQAERAAIWERYRVALEDWAEGHDVRLPTVPPHCRHPSHLFYLVMPSKRAREDLSARLLERGILAPFHYLPLHLSEMGVRLGGRPGACPVTESVSERLLRLPLFGGLSEAEQAEVIESVRGFAPR